jgi:hypothetical protein
MSIDATGLQRIEHGGSGIQRHFSLGRCATVEHRHTTEVTGVLHNQAFFSDLHYLAHCGTSPTMRTSCLSSTPC